MRQTLAATAACIFLWCALATHGEQIQSLSYTSTPGDIALNEDGTILVVGLPGASSGRGDAIVYEWDGSTFVVLQTLEPFGTPSTTCAAANVITSVNQFGMQVVADGEWIAVSAFINSQDYGDIFVYRKGTSSYECFQTLEPLAHTSNRRNWGQRLALDGSFIVTTGYRNSDDDSRYELFGFDGSAWVREHKDGNGADLVCVTDLSVGATTDVWIVNVDHNGGGEHNTLELDHWDGSSISTAVRRYATRQDATATFIACSDTHVFVNIADDFGIPGALALELSSTATWDGNQPHLMSGSLVHTFLSTTNLAASSIGVSRDGDVVVFATHTASAAVAPNTYNDDVGAFSWYHRDIVSSGSQGWGEAFVLWPRAFVGTANTRAGELAATSGERTVFSVLAADTLLVYDKNVCTVQCLTYSTAFTPACSSTSGHSQCWCGHSFAYGDCITQAFW